VYKRQEVDEAIAILGDVLARQGEK
jgi:hypothetical protein